MRAAWVIAAAALSGAVAAGPARAQPLTREELVEALKARDQQIADLQRRLAALERDRAANPPQMQASAAAPPPIAIPPQAETPRQPATASDEEVALQALSRTLVQQGGLLLPAWRMEAIPSFAYSNRIVQGLALAPTPEGILTVTDQRLRHDEIQTIAGLRVGLPWRSQIEVQVPYVWLRQSRSLAGGEHALNTGSGIGDVQFTLSHQFLSESGWRPDLIGAFSWRLATGRDPYRTPVSAIATGSGADEVGGRVTAVKSTEPLVFFGSLTYAHDLAVNEPVGRVQAGDAIGLELGSVLALNPETSMTFGLSQRFRSRTQIDGMGVAGTDTTESSLEIGVGRVLWPRTLLNFTLQVGLTRDAPDYAVLISLPTRFR